MPNGSSYSSVFGAGPVAPVSPQYEALTFSTNQALVWPTETLPGVPYVAAQIDGTATAANLRIAMPSASTGSTGVQTMISNVGTTPFAVTDQAGNQIVSINPSQSYLVSLIDNSTANGSWRSILMGATVAQATAAALAGPGLAVAGTQLETTWTLTSISAPTLLMSSARASVVTWTGAAATLQLDATANLGSGWYVAINNEGSGALTVQATAPDTINGDGAITIQPGAGAFIVGGTGNFVAFGCVASPVPIAAGGTGATTATGALTNLGATETGEAIFTAPNSASVVALLGLSSSILTQSTISTNQQITAGSNGIGFVAGAALTLTLPTASTLSKAFCFAVYAASGAVTIAPQAGDDIFGLSTGASYSLAQGRSAFVLTDATSGWYVLCDGLPIQGGTVTGSVDIGGNLAVAGSAAVAGSGQINGISVGAAGTFNYLYDGGSNSVAIRAGTSGAPQYWTFASSGAFQTASLTVAGNASVGGNVTVTAGISGATGSFSSTLYAGGAASLNSTLAVTGAATLSGNTTVGGTLGVTGAATLSGGASIASSLTVSGPATFTGTQSVSTSGWQLNGAGTSSFSATINNSAYFSNNALAPTFYASSDARLKTDITPITPADGRRFVEVSIPYTFLKEGEPDAGFLAQDQHKAGYAVMKMRREGMKETVDADGYVSPADEALSINYDSRIAFLTAALKDAFARISALEAGRG